jgi:hypothetical protein
LTPCFPNAIRNNIRAGEPFARAEETTPEAQRNAPDFQRFQADGIKAVMSFAAAPGKYSIRAVVREAGQNRIAASSARFEVQ